MRVAVVMVVTMVVGMEVRLVKHVVGRSIRVVVNVRIVLIHNEVVRVVTIVRDEGHSLEVAS